VANNYVWHAMGQNGFTDPEGPAVSSDQSRGQGVEYVPSVTVLRVKCKDRRSP